MAITTQISVPDTDVGERVDVFLAKALPELSRARIQGLLLGGHICGRKGPFSKASQRLTMGECLSVTLPAPKASTLVAEDLVLEILYEDGDLVVLNKAAGMVVHPGAGHFEGTLVNALLHRYPDMHVGDAQRPGLVHRLDKETSGVMVCARNDRAFAHLVSQFKARQITKRYRAFCFGTPKKANFELVTGHARDKKDRTKFTTKIAPPVATGTGVRLAHSRFALLHTAGGVSELSVDLLTGRTHQIRAHLADIHHPLVADKVYGSKARAHQLPATPVREAVLGLERHGLHAELLCFTHPTRGDNLRFAAPLPPDLQALHDAIVTTPSLL